MTMNITAAGICLFDEQMEELANILTETAAALREIDGDLATRLFLWAENVQSGDGFDTDFLAESGQYVATHEPDHRRGCCRCGRKHRDGGAFWYGVTEDEDGQAVDVILCDACHEAIRRPSHASLHHCSD